MSEQTSPTWAEQLITALQALWPVDRPLELVSSDVPIGIAAYQGNAYVQRMEAVTTRIAGLLEYAIRTGAKVRATQP